ncbi:MAG TPA: hypothetical protein PKV16_07230 [Caldisericia bacterium]|nr:hypothetical protein [Caldisericia bacterium]HPF49561.1 hypothetical protein [Caldisericia bacterium]HPI84145.1 hypothetical protein [Caldisericia bacterium]HPQ93560.1 hypothetical protein [Caldisericia bacterium]HRV75434.1 hypothetical protein [Caldisericia bacterium]
MNAYERELRRQQREEEFKQAVHEAEYHERTMINLLYAHLKNGKFTTKVNWKDFGNVPAKDLTLD